MKWTQPPLNKIYEALGAIGDGRVVVTGNTAKVYSSSRNKSYDVAYDPGGRSISSNDNASFYVGYLGYPAIALLLALGVVEFDPKLSDYLAGIKWKDINQQFKNDFTKTDAYIDAELTKHHQLDLPQFHRSLERIRTQIMDLQLQKPTKRMPPPKGY